MALNEQQERFCQSYILHRNASEAARAAGYAKDHAARQGHRLLQSQEVLERITDLEQNLTTDVDVITEIEKQYEYARANGHTNSAIKALERGGLRVIGKTLNDKDTVDIAAFAGTVKKIGSENVLDIVYRKGKPEYYEIVDKNFVAAYQSIGDNVSNVVNFLQTGFFCKVY